MLSIHQDVFLCYVSPVPGKSHTQLLCRAGLGACSLHTKINNRTYIYAFLYDNKHLTGHWKQPSKEKQVPLSVAVKMAASGGTWSSDSESKMVICCLKKYSVIRPWVKSHSSLVVVCWPFLLTDCLLSIHCRKRLYRWKASALSTLSTSPILTRKSSLMSASNCLKNTLSLKWLKLGHKVEQKNLVTF